MADLTFSRDYLDKAANAIDAAMFSGDVFLSDLDRDALRGWMARWERGLKSWAEIAAEADKVEESPFHPESPEGRAWEEEQAHG